jgi:hypothetical protein
MNYLISILSTHLLPNFFLAKEFQGKYDRHIFITTKQMEVLSMTRRFCSALGIDQADVRRIVVLEDNLHDVIEKLSREQFHEDDRFIINLTGGTKIISIGTFNHFVNKTDAFYYVPIGTNKIQFVKTGEEQPLNYRIGVKEYLSLYGLDITSETTEKYSVNENTGAEFEVYVCNRLRSELGIKKDHIFRGVKLFREDSERRNDNEIDVMWTSDNQLYVGECKVSLSKPKAFNSENRPISNPVEYLDEIMYKLSAISKDLGIRVNPYIFIKRPLSNVVFNEPRMKAIKKRLKILGIKGLIDGNELKKNKLIL